MTTKKIFLFIVVSERLYKTIPILDFGEGPQEPYCICELVLAHSREQARYLAWQSDSSFDYDVTGMPNFRTHKIREITGKPVGVVSNSLAFSHLWHTPEIDNFLGIYD